MGYDDEGNLGWHTTIHAEYTMMQDPSKPFDSIPISYHENGMKFYHHMVQDMKAFQEKGIRPPNVEPLTLISCIPWFTYDSVSFQVSDHRLFLRPMFVFGRCEEENGRITMPLTIQVHHACADGYHCGLFFEALQTYLNDPEHTYEG